MMKDRVLIVEDEADIATLIQVHLNELELNCQICHDGEQALSLALKNDYQLILLDVMLPNMNGLDICRQVRQAKPLQAILMLTSKTSETDRILGLELGADDYMTKPFSIRELQARVRTQLRRMHALNTKTLHTSEDNHLTLDSKTRQLGTVIKKRSSLCLGNLVIDHDYHQVTYQDKDIKLTSTEFELLDFFCQHPDQVFSRAQLLDSVWGYHHSGYEHTVNSHINRLRNKLEQDCANPQIIQTVWGVGYKLNSPGVTS
jgi:DNA-binding response OmpR family regulator